MQQNHNDGTPRADGKGGSADMGYGFNGEPLSRPRQRNAGGAVQRTRTDNSIEFPVSQRQPDRRQTQARRNVQQRGTARKGQTGERPQQMRVVNGGARRGQQKRRQAAPQQRYHNQRMRPTDATPQRRVPGQKRKMTREAIRRRRAVQRLTALLLLVFVIGMGIYLTMTMLFKINTITVQTTDGTTVQEIGGYTSDRILQALGVQLEDNIFSFDPAQKEAMLEKQFPMLESIKVERKYPTTVVVCVTEATPVYAMQTSAGWLTLSDQLKILSCDDAQPTGLRSLYGGEPVSTTPGDQLSFAVIAASDSTAAEDDSEADSAASTSGQTALDRLQALNTMLSKLEEYGLLEDVTRIEFAAADQMAFLYQDRISVIFGTLNEIDYKMDRARYMLTNADGRECGPTDTGRLDFSHVSSSSTRKIYFAQGEPTLPSGYVVPEAVEDLITQAETTEQAADSAPEQAEAAEAADGQTAEAADTGVAPGEKAFDPTEQTPEVDPM